MTLTAPAASLDPGFETTMVYVPVVPILKFAPWLKLIARSTADAGLWTGMVRTTLDA